jgi:hypothetical protein
VGGAPNGKPVPPDALLPPDPPVAPAPDPPDPLLPPRITMPASDPPAPPVPASGSSMQLPL